MSTNNKVAVIGLGNIGSVAAANLVKGGRSIIIADRKPEKSQELAAKLGNQAQPMEIPDAIKQADIILLAVWFNAIREMLDEYSDGLAGKIIVDTSNPIAPDDKGGFKKIIDADQSAGQLNSEHLPKEARLVKAFGTLGVASLKSAAFQEPERAVLFYATDDSGIDVTIEQLIKDAGFSAIRVGGIDQSIRLEVFGDLHEFGALGKTVTVAEARTKI